MKIGGTCLIDRASKYKGQWRTLSQILGGGGGQAYCFGRMTSHISIVLEQKTIAFQIIGGPPHHTMLHKMLVHLYLSD